MLSLVVRLLLTDWSFIISCWPQFLSEQCLHLVVYSLIFPPAVSDFQVFCLGTWSICISSLWGEKGRCGFSVLYVDVKFSHAGFTEEAFISLMCIYASLAKHGWLWLYGTEIREWIVRVIRIHYMHIYSCPYKVNDSILRMCSQEWTAFITITLQNIVTTPDRNSAILVITPPAPCSIRFWQLLISLL